MKNKKGIYLIECHGVKYVGKTNNLSQRWSQHKYDLRRGKHRNSYMQRVWDKYGGESFSYTVLEYVEDPYERSEREEFWITELNTFRPNGMNLLRGGETHVFSEESKLKMSLSAKKNKTEETRAKVSEFMMGNTHNLGHASSSEKKKKISNALRGIPKSPEHKKKLQEILNSIRLNKKR